MTTTPRIRVLHVIKSLGRGGAETLLQETLALHDQASFEFHYIYFLPWKDQLVAGLESHGGKVTCLNATNNLMILWKCFALHNYVSSNGIQLVHAHLPWAGFVCRLMHRLWNVPVIYTEHNKQERYHWVTRWLNHLTFNWQRGAIAVSRDVSESVCHHINPRIPVRVIVNGVNTNRIRRDEIRASAIRKELGIPADTVVVGTVAVFRFQKRLDLWLDTFKATTENMPHVAGLVVGDGILRNEIQTHHKTLTLEGKVHMPGLKEDIVPWLSVIDVFMMTSVFEGLPIALLEAMSAGCAVIATNAGGVGEVVRDGVDGVLVPVDKPALLREPLAKLIVDRSYREQLARKARERVVESFSLSTMVSSLEKTYKELM